MFEGFSRQRVATSGGAINLRRGGGGPPLLLLHGYPQTHAMWHAIAPALATRFTVVAADLRGYGDSDKPPGDARHARYTKRAMALDMVEAMAALGFERFALAGHDRGGRVAYRLALDHPDRVSRLAVLDIVPTLDMWNGLDLKRALSIYHWTFLAQPDGLPERLIGADPRFFLREMLRRWSTNREAFTALAMAEYERCFDGATIHASCEDYRAGAGLDLDHDREDVGRRTIACPVLALWGEAGIARQFGDVLAVWRGWAREARGQAIACGHFLPEEAPRETLAALMEFL